MYLGRPFITDHARSDTSQAVTCLGFPGLPGLVHVVLVIFHKKFLHLLLEFRRTFVFWLKSEFLSTAKEQQAIQRLHFQIVLFPNCRPFPSSWVHSASHPAKVGEKVLALTETDGKLNDQWFVCVNHDIICFTCMRNLYYTSDGVFLALWKLLTLHTWKRRGSVQICTKYAWRNWANTAVSLLLYFSLFHGNPVAFLATAEH